MWEALLAPAPRAAGPAEPSGRSVSSCRGWAGTGGFPRLGRGEGGCQLREAELWRCRYASDSHVLADKRFSSQRAPWARPTPCFQRRRQQDFWGRSPPALLDPNSGDSWQERGWQPPAHPVPLSWSPHLSLSPQGQAGNVPQLVGLGRNVQPEVLSRLGFSFPAVKTLRAVFRCVLCPG